MKTDNGQYVNVIADWGRFWFVADYFTGKRFNISKNKLNHVKENEISLLKKKTKQEKQNQKSHNG